MPAHDPPAGWPAERIKAELRARYGHITAISRAWGYHPTAVTKTLAIPGYSAAVERLIAEALEVTPHTLWPSRWSPEGLPVRPGVASNLSALPANPHRQKAVAA
ncbi:MAG: helix-turn-helix domain-containing protein [Roseomonas sp.]|nr:helix-turn-helix domain-containing protein [Roseomonas sp.]